MPYLLLIIAYLCGSIPFGLLFGRLKGIDVRAGGSGNIGATNVSRQLGKTLGLLTLLADAAKAIIPMLLAAKLLGNTSAGPDWIAFCGAAAVLRHMFPLYLRFRGGKGVATALGMLLFLNVWAALLLVLFFIGVVALSGFVSAGSLAAAAMMPVVWWLFDAGRDQIAIGLLLAALIWLKHRENIVRLWRGEEKSWKRPVLPAKEEEMQQS